MAETHKGSPRAITVSYDQHTDTLYLQWGGLGHSVVRDVGKGVLVQLSRGTKRPVGAIIHDFEARFSSKRSPCLIPLNPKQLQLA